jgi:hypothetical protein
VVVTGILDGYHIKFAWFLTSRQTFVADLNSIVSEKEQS